MKNSKKFTQTETDQKRPELTNRKGVVFHQDNGTPHMSVVTCQKLWELGWKVLLHPPYSPDLKPDNYPFFLALQNFHSYEKLGSREDYENRHSQSFSPIKAKSFMREAL
ncbi:histone-lysine N-methyltransferase SETMAR [Trichonephila clavipes]|uniref:Histone-lysine N-methyltransferase SETMAR n=1 Tax=Trichonephila clavipes TaxID=2585209 RepID=A0A8X6SW26_TRICX|nr:histone-lysine N-methyltransferase SETMAR [Trichonephila clavipes]